jgi:type II secretory pathway component PulC
MLVSGLAACGGASASVTASTAASAKGTPAPATTAAPAAASALPDHALRRTAVVATLNGGLGLFLQKVVVDDQPVMKNGRFYGFRVTALQDPPFWSGVDLRPGDVVTRVNGMPIEHPEEALEAFRSLGVASELRVAYERDGQPRELRFSIVDDGAPAPRGGGPRPDEPQKRADASAP